MSNQKSILYSQQAAQFCLDWKVSGSGIVSRSVYVMETRFLAN